MLEPLERLRAKLLKAFYQKLRAKGKPAKVVLTAVMRKLLLPLNSILKTPLRSVA